MTMLNDSQLDKLADVSIGLGHLFLDKPTIIVLILGLVIAVGLWTIALRLVKGVKI